VVGAGVVDRSDRRLGVGVGGQQRPLGLGVQRGGLLQQLHAGQAGHALVDQQQRHGLVAQAEFAQQLQCLRTVGRREDPVAVGVPGPQIRLHRGEHAGLVVDGDDRG
jgi:hypothetical protein